MKNHGSVVAFTMPEPETELSEICKMISDLATQNPDILEMIRHDQERYGKRKKKNRILDKQWRQEKLTPFPELEPAQKVEIKSEELTLEQGKDRMLPEVVLFFMVVRGYLGGFKAQNTQMIVSESMTIHNFLGRYNTRLPGWSTINDQVNLVSNETRSHIFDCQLRMFIGEGLDNFEELIIDSTAVNANACWPTDSGILLQLVERVWRLGNKLHKFGVKNLTPRRFADIIKLLKRYHVTICMSAGKKNSRKKIKKFYRKVLKEAWSALKAFEKEMVVVNRSASSADLSPTQKLQLARMVEWMNRDVESISKVISYCTVRVVRNKSVKAVDKIMSNSDRHAAYIQKGQREAVIGYRPQVGRSKKGFISCTTVPEGNAADSPQLVPMVEQHIRRTCVVPKMVGTDDGYASAGGKNKVERMGVVSVSINGAKGKRITPEEDWESDLFKEARNNRSSVESLIFTIKHNHHFGRVTRRGIEAVRAELLEKVIAYNFCRAMEIRSRKKKSEDPASNFDTRPMVA